MLSCPFCGTSETDRIDLEGRRYIVFGCMFTPRVDPELPDEEVAERLRALAVADRRAAFQGTCDALHVYVTKGEGARFLTSPSPPPADPSRDP